VFPSRAVSGLTGLVRRLAVGQLAKVRALGWELARLPREHRHHRASPPRRGLVLEVGAGQSPHARADVVVDKYPADDFERPGEVAMSFTRPLIVADGQALPFANAAFVYVIAEHVLEHATDPAKFADELSRVAAAGFVQVPSRESELVYGWAYHPWLIDLEDGELVFQPRGDAQAPAGEFMHRQMQASPLTRVAWAAQRSVWHHSVRWRGRLRVTVNGESVAAETASLDLERTLAVLARNPAPALPAGVRSALRCPACHGVLRDDGGQLVCVGCHVRYPVAGNVPVLV
jgi:hypothetical protein